jgi:hypothetical protein
MPEHILTAFDLARYLEIKVQHDHWERRFHPIREHILSQLTTNNLHSWSADGYTAMIREYQRGIFRHKRLLLDHPDLHEQYLENITVRILSVTGPGPAILLPTPPELPSLRNAMQKQPQRLGGILGKEVKKQAT